MDTDPYSSPLAYFMAELKRLRERSGMTQGEVAERTDVVFGTDEYDETTKTHNGDLVRLQRLVERVSVRPWFKDRVDVERKATEIKEYESHQIPGLLQTEEYARAAIAAARPAPSAEDLEQMVALRMTRQQILELDGDLPLDQEPTPRLWAIIDESALHRMVGSPQ